MQYGIVGECPMLLKLMFKECAEHVLSSRYLIECLVCLLLFPGSIAFLAQDYAIADRLHNRLRSVHEQALLNTEDSGDLDEVALVDRPLNPLTLFVRGNETSLTESIRITSGTLESIEAYETKWIESPFPAVDFVFLVGVVLSLLVLSMSYDTISGEHERGTLKLLLSYSLPRDVLLLSKWMGGFVSIATPFLLSSGIAFAIAVELSGIDFAQIGVINLVSLVFLGLLYLGTMQSIGIYVSTVSKSANQSMVMALLGWVLLILLLPSSCPLVASVISPAPSREVVTQQKIATQRAAKDEFDRIVEEWSRQKGIDSKQWSLDREMLHRHDSLSKRAREDTQVIEREYLSRLRSQAQLSATLIKISPYGAFYSAALDLAGMGLDQEVAFSDAVVRYGDTWMAYVEKKQKALIEYMNEQIKAGNLTWTAMPDEVSQVSMDDYPRFHHRPMDAMARLELALPNFLILALWNVVLFLLAWTRFSKYDVGYP